jgi:hypothetical protein
MIIFFICDILNLIFFAPSSLFAPSRKKELEEFFKEFNFEKGKKFFDLGSGDGRVVFLAEKRGLEAYGMEKNASLYFLSLFLKKIKKSKAKFILKDFKKADLKEADYIYLYHLPKFLEFFASQLFEKAKKGAKIISFVFPLTGKEPQEIYKNKFFIYEKY